MEPIINQQMTTPATKNKNWLWIIIVILIAGVVGAGVYYWQNMEAKKMATSTEEKVRSEMQTKITEVESKLAELQTTSAPDKCIDSVVSTSIQNKITAALYKKLQLIVSDKTGTKTSIEDGIVYYFDNTNKKIAIAKSIVDDKQPENGFTYKEAKLSPNKQFIVLGGVGWEWITIEVFDITTGQLYTANASGENFGEWLPDNKLKIIGSCGMGIDCGVYQSVDNRVPWILDKIADYNKDNQLQYNYCTTAPTPNEAGYSTYPIDEKYKNLGHLGELFTADDCNDGVRMSKIYGVSQDESFMYTLGVTINLTNKPSTNLLTTIKIIGFQCKEKNTTDANCKQWELKNSALVSEILKLKPFYKDIQSSDCIHCG